MQPPTFEQTVQKIIAADPRFHAEAYFFVREALDFTRRAGGSRHQDRDVSTAELLEGLRRYGLQSYGPMTATVLAEWGVHRCEDFGEIVFNMIAHHCEGQSDTDDRAHFKSGFSFDEAFRKPFLPSPRALTPLKPVKV
ncbi:MAG TPA: Minf_1886 family protein [Candidatus Acidoferrum sp.]|nr:Minf_1886 family protein [Candidatus Acidoferrum sp.]